MRAALASCVLALLGLSAAAPPARADRFDRQIVAAMKRDGVPGVAIAIVRRGRVVKTAGYGVADLEWGNKVTPHTRFEIASMSKMFTGAAVRLLVDQRALDLDAPVARYLAGTPAAWKPMRNTP